MSWAADRALAGLLAVALGAACTGAPCRVPRDCEAGSYCDVAPGAVEGHCARDCDELWTCPEGSFCNTRGQCQLTPRAPVLELDEPAASVQGEPGETFAVRGRVRFLGLRASLRLDRDDHAGCEVFSPIELTLAGDRGAEVEYPFEVPAIALPDGGGTLRVSARAEGLLTQVERRLLAGRACPDCPRVELLLAEPTVLDARQFFTWGGGRVDGAEPAAVRWRIEDSAAHSLVLPFAMSGAEHLLPLFLGRNLVTLEARNDAGVRRCQRRVETAAPAGDRLLVVLGWDSGEVDLDLHLIPPGAIYGPGDCSAAVSDATRFAGCAVGEDAAAHGPEWALVPARGAGGVYGIVVVGFSGAPGVVTGAHLRVLSRGQLLAALGPRDLQPARGELWVVGTAALGDEAAPASLVIADEVIRTAPLRPPEQWPPY